MTIVINTVYLKVAMRVDFKCFHYIYKIVIT